MGVSKWCTLGLLVGLVRGEDVPPRVVVEPLNSVDVDDGGSLANTDLIHASVIFRHGHRTPDLEELALYPDHHQLHNREPFFPYGTKALTNEGKQRSYRVGEYLRSRYDGLISGLYLPEESVTRTTNYARTQMSALTALAALFPPPPAQKWNPALDWQPVPYNFLPYDEDDLLYWYNCPRYLWLRNQIYSVPEVKKWIKPYSGLFQYLSQKTGTNITTPEDVFYLDNLFQTLENVKLSRPKWAQNVTSKIREMTKIEYAIEFYNTELIKISSGVLLSEIVNATASAISGRTDEPKLRLYSAHENNVAALMAATRVFQPHQPAYGATFSLELRRQRTTGQFGIAAVYSPNAGGPGQVLQIAGCNGELCDYETFLKLIQDYMLTNEDLREICHKLSK